MRIIVDASVIVASLTAIGTVRDVLLSSPDLDFFAPRYVQEEVARNLPRIISRSGLSADTVKVLTDDVFEVVEFLPSSIYAHLLADAAALAKAADAHGDEEYIAIALFLEAPLWVLDNDFRRVKGTRCLNTQEVAGLGA